MGVLNDAIRFARRKTGCLDKAELSNLMILTDLLPNVLLELSNMGPPVSLFTLALQPNVTYYTPPSPGIFRIKLAELHNESNAAGEIHDPLTWQRQIGVRYERYSSPFIAQAAREMERPAIPFSVSMIGGKIRVIPTPSGASSIKIHAASLWSFRYTMATVTTDGVASEWTLDHREVWALTVGLNGEDVDESEYELVRVGSTTKVVLAFTPDPGDTLILSYETGVAYDELPASHQRAFQWLMAWQVAEVVGLKRSKITKFKTASSEIQISGKELLERAEMYHAKARGALSEADGRHVLQGI